MCTENTCKKCCALLDRIKELEMPITGEVYNDVIVLTRNGEVIGEIPFIGETVLLNTFGNIIPDED